MAIRHWMVAAAVAAFSSAAHAQYDSGVSGQCRLERLSGAQYRCENCVTEATVSMMPGAVCTLRLSGLGEFKGFRVRVRPKLGQFGTAGDSAAAYKAGSRAGDDYVEFFQRFTKDSRQSEHLIKATIRISK